MSYVERFPPIFSPPITGRVERVRRRPGHYAKMGEPIVDIRVGAHLVTLCATDAGKVMRCREVGEIVSAGDEVIEITSVGSPTWEVFVSYRRSDSAGHAGHLGERLATELGPGQVFRDLESLPKGPDYVEIVRERLQTASVMVVIIGPRWLDARINDPDDLHREEIRTALQRGIHVQPVLVDGARMPREADLPDDIRPLARRNAIEVTDSRWNYDVGLVLEVIEATLAQSPRRKAFLAQVPQPWVPGPRWHWIADNPPPEKNDD